MQLLPSEVVIDAVTGASKLVVGGMEISMKIVWAVIAIALILVGFGIYKKLKKKP